ncbi:unnamed protein product [Dibothriocephalus latus]|uniref:Uncharacterized protein n=1 Tax=Dibothriocephalus latus TaxID=60516 RepID=A0A3P7M344_DIBLA|nr:unnamed protein product [Dibothriocephalus latus]
MLAAIKYSGKNTEGLIKEGDVQVLVKLILGCFLTKKHRMEEVFRVLNNTDLLDNLASVTLGIPSEELYKSPKNFLRQKSWKNIAILYESSELALDYEAIGETIAYFLANADEPKLNVILQDSLPRDSEPVRIVSRFAVKCHGNVSTYDSLRLWKRALEKKRNLGAAAQCVFLMTGLPSSYGFDMRSEVFNSNISVSVAMAIGMAVGLTYLNLKANNNTISEDEDFFSPIAHRVMEFPVLPNITFYFGLNQKEFIMPYDYYFFGFSENVTWNDFNVSTASFEEIFVLHSVLLWPRTSLADVARKVWPGEGSGPERDYCLQTPCN